MSKFLCIPDSESWSGDDSQPFQTRAEIHGIQGFQPDSYICTTLCISETHIKKYTFHLQQLLLNEKTARTTTPYEDLRPSVAALLVYTI